MEKCTDQSVGHRWHHTTPHHTTPRHTTHITPHHTTSHHTTPHHTTSHHITSHHITPHHITSHHITPHHTTPHHATSPHSFTENGYWYLFLTVPRGLSRSHKWEFLVLCIQSPLRLVPSLKKKLLRILWGFALVPRHNSNRLHMSAGSRC